MFVNFCFFAELLADLIVYKPFKAYSQHFRAWPETICQIINFTLIYRVSIDILNKTTDNYNDFNKDFQLIIFIRCLKLLVLMTEFNSMRIII